MKLLEVEMDIPSYWVCFDLSPHVRIPHFAKLLEPEYPGEVESYINSLGAVSEESREGFRIANSREDAPFRGLRGEWVQRGL